jgi:hypothetical protein
VLATSYIRSKISPLSLFSDDHYGFQNRTHPGTGRAR